MASIDPEGERERLAQLYASMSDGELDRLDDRAHTLTESARSCLDAELNRRDLHFSRPEQISSKEPRDVLSMQDLRTVRQFRDLPEALLAKGFIESAGIPCFLADDNIVRMDWFISNFVGGIKLKVYPNDERAALDLLDQPIPNSIDFESVSGESSYEQPRCPRCYSLDIAYQNLNKPIAYTSAYLGVPIPLKQNSWKCSTCGCEWEETPAE